LTIEPRAVDPQCFDADPEPDPDQAQNLYADPDPDPDPDPGGGRGGEGIGQPKMCIPPGKILGTPLVTIPGYRYTLYYLYRVQVHGSNIKQTNPTSVNIKTQPELSELYNTPLLFT
jgi:hypothetical protein